MVLPQDDDILYEVVDNKVVELGPMGAHEIWLATELVVYLRNFARQHQLGRAVQEMLFDFTAMVQRKRRPDVAFVSYERWPQQRPVPHAEAWEVVPNLVVEVISPSDKGNDILDKVAEYFRMGGRMRLGHLYFPKTGLYLRVTHPGAHPHPRG
jgi:Uma2 family endonuclease